MGHLSALLRKNWILWKKNKFCSCLEILFPAAFCLLFFIFKGESDQIDVPDTSYIELSEKSFIPARLNPDDQPYQITPDYAMNSIMKRCRQDQFQKGEDIINIGKIALAPENEYTQLLSDYFETSFQYESRFFSSKEKINEYIEGSDYGEDICLGISFVNIGENNKWIYYIHYNVSGWGDDEEIPDPQNAVTNKFKAEMINNHLGKWISSGFLTIQNWVDNIILRHYTANDDSEIVPWVTSKKVGKYVYDTLPETLQGNLGTYLILPQIIVYLRMAYALLEEKEKKIKESMKIMGLSDTAFYLSWCIHYGVIYFTIAFLTTILLQLTIYPSSSFILILIWYFLFCSNLMIQSLMVTTFFSRAKIGNVFGMVLFFTLYIVTIILGNNDDIGAGVRTLLAIFPQINTSMSADVFLMSETIKLGIGFGNLGYDYQKFNIGVSLIMFIVSIIVHGIIAIYCDLVIPGEFGAKKHPLFCFPCLFRKRSQVSEAEQQFQEEQKLERQKSLQENVEEVDVHLKDLERHNEVLKLQGLSKVYSNGKKAVNDLNITMYKDQISCLLGHNGSGKTTTISMLTGMQDITTGEATVLGLNVKTQMAELRKIMGVCPQHDVLYPNLSVREHLEMYAQFKGMTDKQKINEEIEQLLLDVDLKFKEHAPTKSLSGGQKRRVSIAIAFIGGSKLVYLDEPTSGCDTSVRRNIWDMLRKYKNDRIVVLTTHFMDEADYLGDRISIIGAGHLICSGSSVYLKQKYGVGYNLTIVKDETTSPSQPIIEAVTQVIPDAKKVSDVSAELAFQLSIANVPKFQDLFNKLDSGKQQLQIANYGISITTLEEVFLKVAHSNKENKSVLVSKALERQISKAHVEEMQKSHIEVDNFDLNSIREKNPVKILGIHFLALVIKRLRYFKRDIKGLLCEMVLPCILIIIGLWAMTLQSFGNMEDLQLEGSQILTELEISKMQSLYGGASTVNKADIDNIASYFNKSEFDMQYSDKTTIKDFDDANFKAEDQETRLGAYFFANLDDTTSVKNYEYYTEIDTLYRDSAPFFVNQMNEAILKRASGDSNLELTTYVSPMPYTQKFLSFQGANNGIQASFTFAMVLSFIPASLIVFIVKEREEQVKHQQIVSGISLAAYWSSNYFVDFMKYFFPVGIFSILMFLAYGIDTFTDEAPVFTAVILLFILYGTAIVTFTYVTSFAFKKFGNAQVLTFFVHYIMGGVAPLIIWLLKLLVESAKPYCEVLEYVFKIFPSFCFGYGMVNLGSIETFYQVNELDERQGAFDWGIAGADILFLALTSIIYYILIFVIEYASQRGTFDKLMVGSGCPQYTEKIYDNDVQKEMDVVNKSGLKDYVVRVKNIRKVYKVNGVYNQAVDRVSFGIKYGECFTLLGVNGAGKTTIFKMLSGDIHATEGDAHINGYDVTTDMAQARYHIGYCPQFDALLENLTSKEHLELYAAIKGIPSEKRKQLIDKKIKEMELSEFENVLAGTYSGGNKRKLSVAVAMIGNPPIVFLDEPSTGMDPVARRYMWDVISRITTLRKQSSVILTTHSMEEAEALSTRMAIQVAGQLKCIGSIQHIKSKFGGGYEVEVKLKVPEEKRLEQIAKGKNRKLDERIDEANLQPTIAQFGYEKFLPLIAHNQIGEDLLLKIQGPRKITLETLLAFCVTEEETQNVNQFIFAHFGEFVIIEHFSTYSRYKIQTETATGKIFGTFEKDKENLNIASYSVKQATIESIFNEFATGKIDTIAFNKKQNQANGLLEPSKVPALNNEDNSKQNQENFQIEMQNQQQQIYTQQVNINNKNQ